MASRGMSSPYVHGSTDDHEIQRLVVQARFVAGFALESFDAPEGSRVLDLGTGGSNACSPIPSSRREVASFTYALVVQSRSPPPPSFVSRQS